MIVARAGDAIVAVGTMKPVTDDIAEIKRVYVRPDARGQGIALAIMARLLDDARTERFAVVRLETMDFMRQAIALYRSIGAAETVQFDGSEAAAAGLEGFTRYLQIRLAPSSVAAVGSRLRLTSCRLCVACRPIVLRPAYASG